jgi:hypothetical protein
MAKRTKNKGAACLSGKTRWTDRHRAKIAAAGVSRRAEWPFRAYRCKECGGYHLTSQTVNWPS